MQKLWRLLAQTGARRSWAVIIVASLVTAVALLLATRIEVRTAMQDTMSPDDPLVKRLAYLGENFPGAVTVTVVLEGTEPTRLIEVATKMRGLLLKKPSVRNVYLEQPVDFFARHALVYLPPGELRAALEIFEDNQASLRSLLADPTTLGLMRAAGAIADESFPASDSVLTLSSRVFGRVLVDELLAGRPAARVGLRLDTQPLQDRLEERTLDVMRRAPLPPSDERARTMLEGAVSIFDLVADVLEQGDQLDDAEVTRRLEDLTALNLERAGLPARFRFNDDKTMLLMEVSAREDLQKLENIRPLLADLHDVLATTTSDASDVKISLTGMPPMYDEEQTAILDNVVLVSLLGLLGILAVFIIGFQRVALPSLATVPLLMGVSWTLGLQGAFAPELNMLNLLFPVLLFGLGIDFAIHLISDYAERRAGGADIEDALVTTYETIVPGLVTGALTTACAFLILLLADLHALRALGFTAGVGVFMALVSMLVVLPALLAIYDRRVSAAGGELLPSVYFGVLERLGPHLYRRRYAVLSVFLVATIALGYFAPRVQFERDPFKLQPRGMPATVLQGRVLDEFQVTGEPSIYFADDLQDADRIYRAAQRARTIAEPVSITMAIPDRQAEKAPIIERIGGVLSEVTPDGEAPTRVYNQTELAELKTHLAQIKTVALELSVLASVMYGPETKVLLGQLRDQINRVDRRVSIASADRFARLDRLIARELSRSFEVMRAMTSNQQVTVENLPPELTDRLRGKDGKWMVLVRANQYVFEPAFLRAHLDELESIDPEVTGITTAATRVLDKITADIPRLTLYTIFAVFLIVLFGLRDLRGTLVALVPLIVGMIWTLGLLGAFGLPLNFVSVLSIPLIVGIGIDDGVHLYHRIKHDRDLGSALAHCGKPVVLTSLTTGIGFGSLLLSVHRGVFYLGLTTAIGIFACLVVSLLLMPALIAIFDDKIIDPPDDA